MSRTLERALATARKAEAKAKAIEQHEKLLALSLEQTKHIRAKDYRAAEEANVEANVILQSISGEQPEGVGQ